MLHASISRFNVGIFLEIKHGLKVNLLALARSKSFELARLAYEPGIIQH